MAKGKKGKPSAARSYARLTIVERREIEAGLDGRRSIRSIAGSLGRSASTVSREVERNRTVRRGAHRGERVTDDLVPEGCCPRLLVSPRVCNGCNGRGGWCGRPWGCEYSATLAQGLADAELSDSRRGIDATEEEAERVLAAIRRDLDRGLSPAQIVAARPDLGVSESTVYRWVDEGYGQMSNMDLRRKVGYKKRSRSRPRATPHGGERSHAAFLRLPEEVRAQAWEMDTVIGRASDTRCLLTLLQRPTRIQPAILLERRAVEAVAAALDGIERALGSREAFSALMGVILADNGTEFCDHDLLERSVFGGRRCRVYCCDPMRSDQKGACERNHVEIRKLLPKGRGGVSFDALTDEDMAVVNSQVSSEPRPALANLTPAFMFLSAYGGAARALLSHLGIVRLPYEDLWLSPDAVNEARRLRGEPPLA